MHSLISLPFHTADWVVLFIMMEINGVLPDLCGLRIALLAEAPAIYLKIMEFQIEVTSQPVCLSSLCKAKRKNASFLIRMDCTS